jgi:hypothetical protein
MQRADMSGEALDRACCQILIRIIAPKLEDDRSKPLTRVLLRLGSNCLYAVHTHPGGIESRSQLGKLVGVSDDGSEWHGADVTMSSCERKKLRNDTAYRSAKASRNKRTVWLLSQLI